MKKPISDNLDNIIAAIKADEPATSEVESAAQRVLNKLQKESALTANQSRHSTKVSDEATIENDLLDEPQLNSLEQYIDAIPSYLAKRLSPALTLLFEEEARQSMDLRRALNKAKNSAKQAGEKMPTGTRKSRQFAWAYSAAAAMLLAVTLFLVSPQFPSFDQSQLAQVEDVSGKLYHVKDGNLQALAAGDWVDGSQTLRTAGETTAMIVLDDGSRIEVGPRAEIQFMRRPHGNRIDVERGKIIVAASPQGSGTLDVMTDEFMVSVTGTIFEVGHGANGSRVSVIEGEVEVHQRGDHRSVVPGEQYATRVGKTQLGIEGDIVWSRNSDEYIAMLKEVAVLQQDIEKVLDAKPRYSMRLLNLVPENTVFYAAVPNAPEKVAELYRVVRDRIQQSETLSENFDDLELDTQFKQLDEVTNWLAEMGDTLGDETVAVLKLQDKTLAKDHSQNNTSGQSATPVILSEVDADAFRENFEERLASLREKLVEQKNSDESSQTDKQSSEFNIVIIDEPAQAQPNQFSIWLHDDLLVASVGVETFQEIEQAIANNGSEFMNSGLYSQLVTFYDKGAKFLGGVDLETLLNLQNSGSEININSESKSESGLKLTGLNSAQFLMVHHGQDSDNTDNANFSAELIFDSARSGVMSWLAEPAPMGSLDFFSINTAFVSAFILRSPEMILDEIKQLSGESWDAMYSESPLAIEIGEDFAASFGGEVAIGLDGPALPTPSWKMVLEVKDESLLQETISRVINIANSQNPSANRHIEMGPVEMGDYNAFQIQLSIAANGDVTDNGDSEKSTTEISIHYAYIDGYLIAAPNAAFLERAINQYQSGIGLLSSRQFQSLLAQGEDFDVSALTFSRIEQLLADLAKNLPNGLSRAQQRDLYEMRIENRQPSIFTVTAQAESIRLAHRGNFLPDISSIMSMRSLAGVMLGDEALFEETSEQDEKINQTE